MLNYNDNEQTLLEFYHTDSLKNSVPDTQDTQDLATEVTQLTANDATTDIQKLDALSTYLQARLTFHHSQNSEHDFIDPLSGKNVVDVLVEKGVIESANDPSIDKFLVSSQQFNPETFLATVHEDTPIERLVVGLDGLDRAIRSHTSELKSVLNDNYKQFVSSKHFIDEILTEFKGLKSHAQQQREKSKVFNPANRRKIDASETLLSELEESINNLNLSSNLMIRPIMEHNAKEAKVAALIEFIKDNTQIFSLPLTLIECLASNDHDAFIDTYNRFLSDKDELLRLQQQELDEARNSGADGESRKLEKLHALQNTALSRVINEVTKIATEYRKKAFKDLLSMDHEVSLKSSRKMALDVKFIDLVDKLHRMSEGSLEVNPIFDFLKSQLQKVEKELVYQCEKYDTKFTQMQRKLVDYITSLQEQRENGSYVKYIAEKFESVEEYFKASALTSSQNIDREKERTIVEIFHNSENLDLSIINETWLVLSNFIKSIEETFASVISKFVKNYVHYADSSNGFNVDTQGELRDFFFVVLNDVISKLMKIFYAQSPSELSKVTPANYNSFLPYHTNSLSTMFYLTDISSSFNNILTLAGKYTSQIGKASKSFDTNKQILRLREVSTLFDQRILEAICATWVNDCSQLYDLENWEKYEGFSESRTSNKTVYTKLMQVSFYYELAVLETLRNLIVRPSDGDEDSIRIVSNYPSKRILVSLEIQFMRSMNVLIDSTIKRFKAEKAIVDEASLRDSKTEQCTYKVLTMNNLSALSKSIFPQLIKKFDKLFNKNLLLQNLKLFADLDLVKITILDDINEIEKAWIEARIDEHFALVQRSRSSMPLAVDPFVYECLLHFVTLVHVLRPITDLHTFTLIIQQLQTQFLLKFLLSIREASEKERVIAAILGNIKLDLDFFVEIFGGLASLNLDEYCVNLVRIILSQIDKIESIFSDLGYTQQEIEVRLERALEQSRSEFSCFGAEIH
ncbi:hypothetical protein PUMCH_003027 [Australozyma saopauloensis]|uniref:Exocyst complex component SEC5 n=1 Tax=Australozyma saopauloensis TaxID=291208 RepID=A0AAX4HBE1_9ASCO|nr:hypothetical protein PUMCH_003027 [[Candida] saopauloensis]